MVDENVKVMVKNGEVKERLMCKLEDLWFLSGLVYRLYALFMAGFVCRIHASAMFSFLFLYPCTTQLSAFYLLKLESGLWYQFYL